MKNNSSKAKRLVRTIAFSHIFVSLYSVWLTRREPNLHICFCIQAVVISRFMISSGKLHCAHM